jgi:hypothetical protein
VEAGAKATYCMAGRPKSMMPPMQKNRSKSSRTDLQKRITYTVEFFNFLKPEQFDGSEDREMEIQIRVGTLNFIGQDFLMHFAIPQFMFHTTTAYNIIRNAGVKIGKKEFLGSAEDR